MQNALWWTYFQTTYYCVWGGEGVGRERGRRRLPGGNFYQMSGYAVCQKCKNTAYFTHKKKFCGHLIFRHTIRTNSGQKIQTLS